MLNSHFHQLCPLAYTPIPLGAGLAQLTLQLGYFAGSSKLVLTMTFDVLLALRLFVLFLFHKSPLEARLWERRQIRQSPR